MTDQELEELKAQEQKLFAELQPLEEAWKDASNRWHVVYERIKREELKRELRAEIDTEPDAVAVEGKVNA